MLPRVTTVTQTGPFTLRIHFDDGAEGEVDIQTAIPFKGVFAPLQDPSFFAQVKVDVESGTIVWPNGADLDPLVLHSRVTGVPVLLESAAQKPARG